MVKSLSLEAMALEELLHDYERNVTFIKTKLGSKLLKFPISSPVAFLRLEALGLVEVKRVNYFRTRWCSVEVEGISSPKWRWILRSLKRRADALMAGI